MSVEADDASIIRPSAIVMACVKTLRILGGFPYVLEAGAVRKSSKLKAWGKEAIDGQASKPNSLAKSTWLVVWSWAMVLGFTALSVAVPIANIFWPTKSWVLLKGNTLLVASNIYV